MNHHTHLFLEYVPFGDGVCGGNDDYPQATYTLEECMEECRQDVECTAITFKEVHGGCGFHKGAIQIISNAHWENIVQETGFTCFERQGKVFDNMFVISFTV